MKKARIAGLSLCNNYCSSVLIQKKLRSPQAALSGPQGQSPIEFAKTKIPM